MTGDEFEEQLRSELKSLNVDLLTFGVRRNYLCLTWKSEPYDPFTSAFRIPLGDIKADNLTYQIVQNIFQAMDFPDTVVAQIKEIRL